MYISTREMVISIICNACGVLGLILWAIEAHKSNASQRIQSVESVDRKDEPQKIMEECYSCKWWNYSYGCSNKKGICEFEPLKDEQSGKE